MTVWSGQRKYRTWEPMEGVDALIGITHKEDVAVTLRQQLHQAIPWQSA
jgi:hypothetical protein